MRHILYTFAVVLFTTSLLRADGLIDGRYVFAVTIADEAADPSVATISRQKDDTMIISFTFLDKLWSAPIHIKTTKRTYKVYGRSAGNNRTRSNTSTREVTVRCFNTVCQSKDASSSVTLSGVIESDGSLRGVMTYHFGIGSKGNTEPLVGHGKVIANPIK